MSGVLSSPGFQKEIDWFGLGLQNGREVKKERIRSTNGTRARSVLPDEIELCTADYVAGYFERHPEENYCVLKRRIHFRNCQCGRK